MIRALHCVFDLYCGSDLQIASSRTDSMDSAMQDEEAVPFDDVTLGALLGKGRCLPGP